MPRSLTAKPCAKPAPHASLARLLALLRRARRAAARAEAGRPQAAEHTPGK